MTTIEVAPPARTSMQALRVILNEHRALAAVLHGMRYIVHDIRDRRTKPNFELLRAMVYYIDAFPERFHHPKEDRYLFRILRQRCPEAGPLLDRLQLEHSTGAEKIRMLEQALHRYEAGGEGEFAKFLAAVESYATFHWGHMRTEENEVLPLASKSLLPADWDEIDAAFLGHVDPMLGAKVEARYDELFTRIVNLAPPPIGLGPEAEVQERNAVHSRHATIGRDDPTSCANANVSPIGRARRSR